MIRTAAVLGAGTMGAQIAAHLANAGLPVLLLDVTADAARAGLDRARRLKPDPFFLPDTHALIRTGSFDDGLGEAGSCDWIVEAVVERLDVKQALLARLAPRLATRAIVSTNTSGIPIRQVAESLPATVAARFLGTHFFNPPRYLPLVELVPTAATDPSVVAELRLFLDRRLGKGVVVAHDRPGFIANRIGVYGMARTLDAVASGRFSIDEVDALTGPAIGRPKSATFRTADIAGLDILAKVASDLETSLSEEAFRLPPFVEAMVAEGAVGEKAGRGFFRKAAGGDGGIHVRDVATGSYGPRSTPRFPSAEAARSLDDAGARIRTLFLSKDRAGDLLRATLGTTLLYAARVAPEVAGSIDDVDRAMRWGFAWQLGPFETWDAIGIHEVLAALGVEPVDAPEMVAAALAGGRNTFRDGPLPPAQPEHGLLRAAVSAPPRAALRANASASLVDLGDGVLAVNLHSKMNAIGGDTLEMLEAGVATAASGYSGLVIATEGPHFSAGANLLLLLLAAQEGEWEEIDLMVRGFQRATMALRQSPVPVVSATAGMALGGGCEIVLHSDRAQAAAESYIGLVEVGVGLIPAAGGTKEMLARAMEAMPDPASDLLPHVQRVFETIGFAKVSTSAPDARRLGYLRSVDGVTMNRERVVADAKQAVLARSAAYQPPAPRLAIPVGGPDVYAALALGIHLAHRAGRVSDHDATIGRHLARVLTGGDVPHRTTLTEQQLLDLEREAFLKLTGEPRTLERISHTLQTGKVLRN